MVHWTKELFQKNPELFLPALEDSVARSVAEVDLLLQNLKEQRIRAQRIFLQHLFIKQRKYPIDCVKWLREQCSQILAMPKLYQELIQVIDGIKLTENGILEKSELLEKLFMQYGFQNQSISTK